MQSTSSCFPSQVIHVEGDIPVSSRIFQYEECYYNSWILRTIGVIAFSSSISIGPHSEALHCFKLTEGLGNSLLIRQSYAESCSLLPILLTVYIRVQGLSFRSSQASLIVFDVKIPAQQTDLSVLQYFKAMQFFMNQINFCTT